MAADAIGAVNPWNIGQDDKGGAASSAAAHIAYQPQILPIGGNTDNNVALTEKQKNVSLFS